jgi:hypothetical protein
MTDDAKYQEFVTKAFIAAGLPEVEEHQLETGTYTNAQIAEKMRGDPRKLLSLLMGVSNMGKSQAEKRSILSFAVDMVDMVDENQ